MFDQVLVPLDRSPGSERVVRPAIALAGRLGARLVLWGVVFDRADVPQVEAHLAEVLRREAAGRGELHVTYCSDPAAAIVAAAEARPGTLIAMTTHARGQIGEAVLGSVSYEVLRRTTTPVLFVGPHYDEARTDFSVVAACVDGSPVADEVVGPAASLAREAGLGITVLRAVTDDAPRVLADGLSLSAAAEVPVDVRDEVEARAARLGPRARADVVVDGHPAEALVRWAERTPGAVLALATHRVAGSDKLTMGSVSSSVVRRSPVPVLVVPAVPALV